MQHSQLMSPLMTEPAFRQSTVTQPDQTSLPCEHRWVHPAERSCAALPQGEVRPFCAEEHCGLKAHEATWQTSQFSGYEFRGLLLGEVRYCPVCQASVERPVKFATALRHVVEQLLCPQPAQDAYVQAALSLAAWAQSHLPVQLGISTAPLSQGQLDMDAPFSVQSDWRKVGQELRQRRERAGLTRMQLGCMAGIADSTIRNFETGRHRPTRGTILRLATVSALRTASVPE